MTSLSDTISKTITELEKKRSAIYEIHDHNTRGIRGGSLCHDSPLEDEFIDYKNCPCRNEYQRINAQIQILLEILYERIK